jgi:hypothetical protein
MNVDHALVACCRDDDKAIALIGLKPFMHISARPAKNIGVPSFKVMN